MSGFVREEYTVLQTKEQTNSIRFSQSTELLFQVCWGGCVSIATKPIECMVQKLPKCQNGSALKLQELAPRTLRKKEEEWVCQANPYYGWPQSKRFPWWGCGYSYMNFQVNNTNTKETAWGIFLMFVCFVSICRIQRLSI